MRSADKTKALIYKRPDIAEEWDYKRNHPLTPYNRFPSSKDRVGWICKKCGHKWDGIIQVRCEGQRKCPSCNSLAVLFPELTKEWCYSKNKKDPHAVNPNTHDRFFWVCSKNKRHVWKASPNARVSIRHRGGKVQKTTGCPYCSNKKVCKDNCLSTIDPNLSKEWDCDRNSLTPKDIVPFSDKKIHWNCGSCGHKWIATPKHRSRGNGCPACSRIYLKDGTICDSLIEAYFYLKFKNKKQKFVHHGKYGGRMGGSKYDFYFPRTNTYMEVTSYNKNCFLYKDYFRKIRRKKYFVEKTLKAKFEFMQRCFSAKEYRKIKEYICRDRHSTIGSHI